jgi:hypothetical protein
MLQAGKLYIRDPMMSNDFLSIYLILPATLGPGFHSASIRNYYHKQKNNVFGE